MNLQIDEYVQEIWKKWERGEMYIFTLSFEAKNV